MAEAVAARTFRKSSKRRHTTLRAGLGSREGVAVGRWRGVGITLGCAAVLAAGGGTVSQAAVPVKAPVTDEAKLPQVPEYVEMETGCTRKSRRVEKRTPWGQQLLGVRPAQELSLGEGVTVGIVDTGVDTVVPALEGRASGDGKQDCVGHGTFTAGIVAGARQEGIGFVGVAPQARVFGVRATTPEGATDADAIADGIDVAVRRGSEVVLVSVAYGKSSKQLRAAVERAAKHDVVVVAPASGGQQSSAPAYPAALPGVVSVASVGLDGGPFPAGRKALPSAPDLVAPGDRVMSVGPGGGSFTGGGDSVAAAFVAGAAALVRAHEPSLSAGAVGNRLRATALRTSGSVPDPDTGYGLVDPAGAISGVVAESAPATVPQNAVGDPYHVPEQRTVSSLPAWGIVAGSVFVIMLTGAAAVLVPRGRARGWRAG
ncbi:S8 family serine peptidase [Streptomyces chartreusis]|uniref:S8 family serine peptidase n=1 Tax=Streptomyces chartreusis TaxID=1969 RepID=UPI0037F563C6